MKREEAEESIAWANACAKSYYDASHKPIALKVGDSAFLKLHHGYTIPGLPNKKLSQQRVGPFKILERVGSLAYRLQLPPVITINPVISIAHLEPLPAGLDPYHRERNTPKAPVVTDDQLEDDEYYAERLLDKRIVRGRVQFLVKWLHYGHEHNVWYSRDDLDDAQDKIDQFEKHHTGI